MRAAELVRIEESLGVALPDSYRTALRRLARSPLRGMLADLVCTDAQTLIELNEMVLSKSGPVAGLPDWPDDLFVIGGDDCGNYYAIRHDEGQSPVIYFDLEADELQQCANSIEEFCKRIDANVPFDRLVLHSGYRAQRRSSPSGPAVLPSFRDQPGWTKSWSAFLKVFSEIAAGNPNAPETISKLNRKFGSRAVRWIGRVHGVELGKYPYARIGMPRSPASEPFPRLDRLSVGLRWAGRRQSTGLSIGDGGTPQVLTAARDWRGIRPGYRIQFLMMFAPGLNGEISCVAYHDTDDDSHYSINHCGVHVLRVLERSRPSKELEW